MRSISEARASVQRLVAGLSALKMLLSARFHDIMKQGIEIIDDIITDISDN